MDTAIGLYSSSSSDVSLEAELTAFYPCTKGCNQTFFSEESRKKHEYFDCKLICFEIPLSPLPNFSALIDISPTEPPFPNNNGFHPDSYGQYCTDTVMYQDIGAEIELETKAMHSPNIPPINYGYRTAEQIMTSTKKSNNNTIYQTSAFSEEVPMGIEGYGMEEKIPVDKENNSENTLADLNSEDSMGSLLIFNGFAEDVVQVLSEGVKEQMQSQSFLNDILALGSKSQEPVQYSLDSNPEESFEAPYNTEVQSTPSLSFNDLAESASPLLQVDTNDLLALNQPLPTSVGNVVLYVTEEKIRDPPKKRGRPRKQPPNLDVKSQNICLEDSQFNPYICGTVLPERKSKIDSLNKIRSLCEGFESAPSDQELSSVRANNSRKRPLKVASTHEIDPEEKKRLNNIASKNSREKRKKKDKTMEMEMKQLEERNKYLSAIAKKLQDAYDIYFKRFATTSHNVA